MIPVLAIGFATLAGLLLWFAVGRRLRRGLASGSVGAGTRAHSHAPGC